MKRIFRTLAVSSAIGAGTLFAGTFSDVPLNHWAYKAVEKVSSAGIIKGWKEKFQGTQEVTRYEMAVVVARMLDAVRGGATMDDGTARNLTRLVTEFSNELALLGADVDALRVKTNQNEKRIAKLESAMNHGGAGGGNINWSGSLGLRWEAHFADGLSDRIADEPQYRLELNASGQANSKTWWEASLRTGQRDWSAESWRNFGTDSAGVDNAAGNGELDLARAVIGYQATDSLKFGLGKQVNPFANTELVFDHDVNPVGLTEEYKLTDSLTVRAGQYYFKSGTDWQGLAQDSEDVYLFAHQLQYDGDCESGNGKWTISLSNLNFSGEQFLHANAGVPFFNRVASATATTFENLGARSGNLYNVAANNVDGNAHSLNATTAGRQLRLLSDFNLANVYVGYHNDEDPTDPWGIKLDYVINNSAWNTEDTGWWFEIYRGSLEKKGDVLYGYQYKRVEADAVLAFLNEDQLRTNVKGSSVFLHTRVQDNMDWFATYFLFEPIESANLDKEGLLRTGLNLKF